MKGLHAGIAASLGAILLGVLCIVSAVYGSNVTLLIRSSVVEAVACKYAIWPPIAGASYDVFAAIVKRIRGDV